MEQKKEQTTYKRRLSSTIPYGWKLVEGSTDLLEEVPLELAYLEKAKEYLKASFLFMLFLEESRGNSFCKS